MADKFCKGCGALKPVADFYTQNKVTGALFSRCKECHKRQCVERCRRQPEKSRETKRRWREANPERAKEVERRAEEKRRRNGTKQAYRRANAERIKAKNAEYRERNREAIRSYNAAYRRSNRALLKERQRQWRLANPEDYRAIHRRWKQANKAKVNAATHRRRARLAGCAENYTAAEWVALVKACDRRCLCCGRQEPEIKLTVDHIVPVSEGGSNAVWNIQPLCKSCNSAKHTKTLDFRPEGE